MFIQSSTRNNLNPNSATRFGNEDKVKPSSRSASPSPRQTEKKGADSISRSKQAQKLNRLTNKQIRALLLALVGTFGGAYVYRYLTSNQNPLSPSSIKHLLGQMEQDRFDAPGLSGLKQDFAKLDSVQSNKNPYDGIMDLVDRITSHGSAQKKPVQGPFITIKELEEMPVNVNKK